MCTVVFSRKPSIHAQPLPTNSSFRNERKVYPETHQDTSRLCRGPVNQAKARTPLNLAGPIMRRPYPRQLNVMTLLPVGFITEIFRWGLPGLTLSGGSD